jgi:putative tricarboxylic transport membrane protein
MSDTNAPDVRKIDLKELASGLLLILVAAAFAASALRNLSLGSAASMGPGYFPLLVTMPLALIGLIVTARAFGRGNAPQETIRPLSFVLVLAAPIAFALTVKGLGFVGAIALTVLVSAWASRAMTVRTALIITMLLSILCVGIFYHLLRMPLVLAGPWLTTWLGP